MYGLQCPNAKRVVMLLPATSGTLHYSRGLTNIYTVSTGREALSLDLGLISPCVAVHVKSEFLFRCYTSRL